MNGKDYKRHHDQVDIEMEEKGEEQTHGQKHREEQGERRTHSQRHGEEPGERRAHSQRHREEPADERRTQSQRHGEEPGERRTQSQKYREEPAGERRTQSQRHPEEHGERRTQSQKYREEKDEPRIQTRKHGLDAEVKRRRSRSKSPRPAHPDDWKNPSGSMKNGEFERKRDSTKSGDQRHRRLSDDGDAYHLIREASYRKDPRRASEPAAIIKPRYPPPPALETYPTQPRSFLWLAMLTAIVNIVFGIIALVCAITSDNAWAAGRREEAKKRGLYALGFCIVGIICTAIIIIAVPVSFKYMRI